MERLVVNPTNPEAGAIAAAAEILRAGGVVAFPTDTLYGLAVDPRRSDAVERLFRLKGRDAASAIPLIADSLAQASAAATFGARERRAAAHGSGDERRHRQHEGERDGRGDQTALVHRSGGAARARGA